MNRLCVFAHYDRDNLIDTYVMYYLESLKTVSSNLIFVSTSKIDIPTIERLKTICNKVIVRDNAGYDFMSWKTGLYSISNLSEFDELIICNDSVYGPLFPLKPIFDTMTARDCDFWGMTQNSDFAHHLQSYFLVFKRKVIQSQFFKDFWDSVRVESKKWDIVEKYEIGLTQILLSVGFIPAVYAPCSPSNVTMLTIMARSALRNPSRAINKIFMKLKTKTGLNYTGRNPSILSWKELIVNCKMPFLKVELLRDNPTGTSIKGYEDIIRKRTNYDIELIRNHLGRIIKSDSTNYEYLRKSC